MSETGSFPDHTDRLYVQDLVCVSNSLLLSFFYLRGIGLGSKADEAIPHVSVEGQDSLSSSDFGPFSRGDLLGARSLKRALDISHRVPIP
jgi:hypothetical protein